MEEFLRLLQERKVMVDTEAGVDLREADIVRDAGVCENSN